MLNGECSMLNVELNRARADRRSRIHNSQFNIQHSTFLVLLLLLVTACSKSDAQQQGGASRRTLEFPVEAHPVEARKVEYTINSVGSLDAFERVEVTSRVSGAIERVLFSEGQLVQKGQPLVEIEPERYRLAVDAAEATLQKSIASREEAQAGFARRQTASAKNPGLIRGEEIETWRTRVQTAAAEVSQSQAALAQAKLNLRDAFVRAPVAGIIQTRTVQTGQYVQLGTVIATLVQRDPLLLRFQVPEQESGPLRTGIVAHFTAGESSKQFSARIMHVAAAASSASRMVDVTAHVVNPNQPELRPGAFARVTVPVGDRRDAPVIPQTAIRPSERGFLAYVVENGTARQRVLTLGMRTADGQVEVRDGVRPGELLVTRGAEALRDGAKVKVER